MNHSLIINTVNILDEYSPKEVKKEKPPPQSRFESEECSSNDELAKVCFTTSPPANMVEISCISSESSVSSESDASVSDVTPGVTKTEGDGVLCSYMQNGTCMQVNKSIVSRQGRNMQRWERDSQTSAVIRLTTGTIPITNDGRIVFVSSARKKEWILPKGGWESDETMEESALRETYEEAGMLGILGSRLSDVCFETRKAKKRRLEGMNEAESTKCATCSISSTTSSNDPPTSLPFCTLNQKDVATFTPPVTGCEFCKTCAPPRTFQATAGPMPNKYDMCRMTLFPLYITKVLDNWPESGRSRKLCSIDEAIQIARSEFKEALIELKAKNLHLSSNLK